MANITEELSNPQWAEGIYQLETTDPVLGGPNGIANRQAKELAARTQYLKKKQEEDKPGAASTTKAGIVQLSSATDSNSEELAATPKAVKAAYDKAVESAGKAAVVQNKSDKGHTHRAAEITDFAEAAAALTVHQKIGTFDICKLPDGTQIESGTVRIQNHNNNSTAQVLTWPLAFVTDPVVVATMSAPEGNVRDMWVTIDSRRSDRSAVHYWLFEPAYNTTDVTVNFVAIGRWK